MKTRQEIFDTVLTYLRAQKIPAKDAAGDCKYRGPFETKCAVGCLIPDEHYDPDIEENGIYGIINQSPRAKALKECLEKSDLPTDGESLDLLSRLQRAHDNMLEPSDLEPWETEMRKIACEFGLDFTKKKWGQ